jgi:hypothetical protein
VLLTAVQKGFDQFNADQRQRERKREKEAGGKEYNFFNIIIHVLCLIFGREFWKTGGKQSLVFHNYICFI